MPATLAGLHCRLLPLFLLLLLHLHPTAPSSPTMRVVFVYHEDETDEDVLKAVRARYGSGLRVLSFEQSGEDRRDSLLEKLPAVFVTEESDAAEYLGAPESADDVLEEIAEQKLDVSYYGGASSDFNALVGFLDTFATPRATVTDGGGGGGELGAGAGAGHEQGGGNGGAGRRRASGGKQWTGKDWLRNRIRDVGEFQKECLDARGVCIILYAETTRVRVRTVAKTKKGSRSSAARTGSRGKATTKGRVVTYPAMPDRAVLHTVLDRFRPKDAVFKFMWIEAGSSIAAKLNIPVPPDTVPRLVALAPYRQRVDFFPSEEDIEEGIDLDEPGEILDWLQGMDLPIDPNAPAWKEPARDPDELWSRVEESRTVKKEECAAKPRDGA